VAQQCDALQEVLGGLGAEPAQLRQAAGLDGVLQLGHRGDAELLVQHQCLLRAERRDVGQLSYPGGDPGACLFQHPDPAGAAVLDDLLGDRRPNVGDRP
jgi:hypothetical protein